MLLFLLCAYVRTDGASGTGPALLREPSTVLLKPWVAGDSGVMELAAVPPFCNALAAAVSMRGAAGTSPAAAWLDGLGIDASRDLL